MILMIQSHSIVGIPVIPGSKIMILQSKWYKENTSVMVEKCTEVLKNIGANIETMTIPGCLEFALCAQQLCEKRKDIDAFVCIGVLMKGETDHYQMILESCVTGMTRVSLKYNIPLINAILPVGTVKQINDRTGDNSYNKGIEAAIATAEYIAWKKSL